MPYNYNKKKPIFTNTDYAVTASDEYYIVTNVNTDVIELECTELPKCIMYSVQASKLLQDMLEEPTSVIQ